MSKKEVSIMADLLTLFVVKRVLRNGQPCIMLEDTSTDPVIRLFFSKQDALWIGKELVKEAKKIKTKETK